MGASEGASYITSQTKEENQCKCQKWHNEVNESTSLKNLIKSVALRHGWRVEISLPGLCCFVEKKGKPNVKNVLKEFLVMTFQHDHIKYNLTMRGDCKLGCLMCWNTCVDNGCIKRCMLKMLLTHSGNYCFEHSTREKLLENEKKKTNCEMSYLEVWTEQSRMYKNIQDQQPAGELCRNMDFFIIINDEREIK